MKFTDRMEQVEVAKLIPNKRNARTHSPEQIEKIRKSLNEFGFVNPVLVDEGLNIIAGHGRIEAAKLEGIEKVPCVFVEHLTATQRKAYILADNRLAELAGWDMEMVDLELTDLQGLNFDIELTGFDLSDFAEPGEVHEDDEFDIDAALTDTPAVKLGEVYQLGRHRLMCGDSTVALDVEKLMAGEKADIVFTDPPWNVNYGVSDHPNWKNRSIMNDHMDTEDFSAFLFDSFKLMAISSKPGGMAYVVMSAQEWGNIMPAMSENGFHWSSTIIWAKNQLVLSRKDYHTRYEPIWYGWFAGDKAAPRLCPLEDRKQSDVWEVDRPQRSELHPTMKPIELVSIAIRNSSHVNDLCVDLFGGSGSTLISCEQLDRSRYTMELDPKYAQVIIERYISQSGSDSDVYRIEDDGSKTDWQTVESEKVAV